MNKFPAIPASVANTINYAASETVDRIIDTAQGLYTANNQQTDNLVFRKSFNTKEDNAVFEYASLFVKVVSSRLYAKFAGRVEPAILDQLKVTIANLAPNIARPPSIVELEIIIPAEAFLKVFGNLRRQNELINRINDRIINYLTSTDESGQSCEAFMVVVEFGEESGTDLEAVKEYFQQAGWTVWADYRCFRLKS